MVRYGEGLVSQWRRELRSCGPEGVIPTSQRRSELHCCGPEGSPKKYYPPQRRMVLRCGGPESMGTVFFLSTFKIITLLKLITVRMLKKKFKKLCKTVKRNGSNMNLGKRKSQNAWVASQEVLCLMSLARHSCISMLYSRGIGNAKAPSWCSKSLLRAVGLFWTP